MVESRGSGVAEMLTLIKALAETEVPSAGLPPMPGLSTLAVMATMPLPTEMN